MYFERLIRWCEENVYVGLNDHVSITERFMYLRFHKDTLIVALRKRLHCQIDRKEESYTSCCLESEWL